MNHTSSGFLGSSIDSVDNYNFGNTSVRFFYAQSTTSRELAVIGPYNMELVPAGSWERSLAQLARARAAFRPRWEQIRRRELDRAGYRCEICRADGLLECNERWSYDDVNRLQKLIGYQVVCPECLSILHIDKTMQAGGLERALSHFIRVTGFTEEDLKIATTEALKTWRRRSLHRWRVDVSSEPLASGLETLLNSGTRRAVPAAPPKQSGSRAPEPATKPIQSQSHLSVEEIQYLKSQRLARIATVSPRGVPEVSPVGFEYDGRFFWVGSHDQRIFFRTQRYRNIKSGNTRVSLVVDDLQSVDPWKPRGMKVSGTAEVMDHHGIFGSGKYFRITPQVTVSWGIEEPKKGQWVSKKTFR